ncbi:sugar-binding protein [Streptomyces halobius]|uniref:Sugar-binding protein n=2 Tax=Streptomyces halobius TaxID=2879846 RepID=A0ABY4MIL0_9ACTN|nr:RHS repeat-associated core domain-containing protein [Streptomyces halobius]UQA97082.1 sugar-binding protein [Streptomyces halobius]
MHPIPAPPGGAGAARKCVALALSVLMVGGLIQGATASPSAAQGSDRPGLLKTDKPVPGQDGIQAQPRKVTSGPRTPAKAPKADWPKSQTATVDLSRQSGKHARRAGDLPVGLAPAGKGKGALDGTVEAKVLDRGHSERAGLDGLLFTLAPKNDRGAKPAGHLAARSSLKTTAKPESKPKPTPEPKPDSKPEPAATTGDVSVTVDYGDFAGAFGGGYASRLKLIQLPACVLTNPGKTECRTGTPVDAKNDTARQTLTADAVSLRAGRATVFAAAADTKGDKGDYKATPLSPSASWQTNLNTGDFTWAYDMPVPEVPGGLAPDVGLSYNSGTVDGRTGATNNQASWVGDGFDLSPGFIERRYVSCAEDGQKNADGTKPGDLCWKYDNAFVSFNGKGGELVPAGNDEWKLQQDDGTKIKRLKSTNRGNGDNDGEYWRVTDPNGTRYYFGYHRLPGWKDGKETTDSTWTVPVFGNNSGEPCHAGSYAKSWCQQAWRWNLDYVVDTHGNAISYFYGKETNHYGRNLRAEDETPYTRGGYLKRIDYGLKSSSMYGTKPEARVVFGNSERCLPKDGVTCTPDAIGKKSFYWYDTPWDLNCEAGKKCDGARLAPSFWTRKRLTEVSTEVLKADGSYGKVDSWKLDHRWGMADTDYQLLLDSVQHTGHTASPAITLPKTTFAYTQLANRMDKTGDGFAPFIKSRLSTVADESGGQIDARYSAPACDPAKLPTPQSNTTRCFPQYIGGDAKNDPVRQWFNKYVVTSVVATDRTGGSPDQVTTYDYLDGGAWHYNDDDGLTKEKHKTWSQWRGYGHVRVKAGGQGGASAMKSQTDTYFLRGMNGDRKEPSGGTKSVSVPLGDGEGSAITDDAAMAGFTYKTVQFDKPGGNTVGKTVNRPWHHETAKKVRDWGTVTANFTGSSLTRAWTSLDGGAGAKWRTASTVTSYDTVAGRVTSVDDRGEDTTDADDRCTRTTYATNVDKNILQLPSRVETVAKGCADTADRSKDVISDVRTAYDGGAYGAAPTKGDATATATLKSHDGAKASYLESGATFDNYGRELTTTDLTADVTAIGDSAPVRTKRTDGRTTTTSYTPATGLPTQTKTASPPARRLDPKSAQTTTSQLDPLRGHVLKETDTNGKVTQFAYDALGRSTKVWLADRKTSSTPTYEFAYRVVEGKPVAVATKLLDNNGGQVTSYKLYDGFLRERQSQAPGPEGGRLVADVFYDERGLVTKKFADYYADGKPVTELFKPADALPVESQTRTAYDGLGRPVQMQMIAGNGDGGKVLNTTTTSYLGDRTTVIPPAGETATTTITDVRGRTVELRQHHERKADAAYDSTTYEYTPSGQPSKVTDPAGNSWTTTYDQLGRTVASSDPDKGTTTSTYDDHNQLISSTDARGVTLVNVYDDSGRKTEVREGSRTGKLRLSWTYDTIPGAKGQLAESTRYVGDAKYTTKVTGYDRLYRPARTAVVIPKSEGALAGTYQTGTAYKPSGKVASISYSAAGSLPGGSVNYGYEADTLRPTSVFGQGMTASTKFSHTGKPLQHELGLTDGGKKTWVTNTYEWGTQRLATTRVDREDQKGVDQQASYSYDEAGNVLSIKDVSRTGTDNQCFRYDYLRRLTEAWTQDDKACGNSPSAGAIGGPAPYWHSYTYDKTGNRLSETRHDPTGDSKKDVKRAYTYPKPGTAQAHALTSVTTEGPAGTQKTGYAYDKTGNTTGRGDQKLTWDAEGNLAKVTDPVKGKPDKVTEYLYDADGQRLISRTGERTTLHLGHTEVTLDKGATKTKATRYVDLGSGHQAVRSDDGSFSFTIGDHHGTGLLAVAAGDMALSQRRVLPFGGTRGEAPKSWPGTKGFVGGTDETKRTGFTHLGAREYDPGTGRFLSVDPVMVTSDAQQMHGYTYGNNNPLVYADPSGKFFGWFFNQFMNSLVESTKNAFKVKNKNPGASKPRAYRPKVTNTKLADGLMNIYAKDVAKKVYGDGKAATAIIYEFNNGKRLDNKEQWHIKKGWSALRNMSSILELDRKARETGKNMKNLLNDHDLAIAKSEAKELWNALSSRDVTGKVDKTVQADAVMKDSIRNNMGNVMKTAAVKDLTGQKFEPTKYKGPQPVGEPTRLRGFAKSFGIAGGVTSAAQAPSYVGEYGWKRGGWELFKDVVDPFGVSKGQDSFYPEDNGGRGGGGICAPSSGNCA